jgi:hypothetical protein
LPDTIDMGRKTLVINLNKTMVKYEYVMGTGFEIIKRPDLVKFLQRMAQEYEIVIFGEEDSHVSIRLTV